MQTLRQFLSHSGWTLVVPAMLFIGTVLGGLLLRKILFASVRRWAKRTDSHLDVFIVEGLNGPSLIWFFILAVHVATQNSDIPERFLKHIPTTLEVLWLVSLMLAASHSLGNIVRFYGGRVTGGQSVTSLTQKLAQVSVVIVGVIWILKVVFDFNLTPVLTTLGVGGLAVALAFQDTLSNLFAGFYTSMSGLVRIGDYIKLNTGEEGYVVDIAWRSTTIRALAHNLIVVPNAKLGQAIFTNYSLPEPRMGISLTFNVGYDMDVERVLAMILEEAVAATADVPNLLADPAPSVVFSPGMGDYSLGFTLNIQVDEFSKQGGVQSEVKKRVFKRFLAEGVTMPFPTRTIKIQREVDI